MPTQQDVLDAFDSFGDYFVPAMALEARLCEGHFDPASVTRAVSSAVESGALVHDKSGQLHRP